MARTSASTSVAGSTSRTTPFRLCRGDPLTGRCGEPCHGLGVSTGAGLEAGFAWHWLGAIRPMRSRPSCRALASAIASRACTAPIPITQSTTPSAEPIAPGDPDRDRARQLLAPAHDDARSARRRVRSRQQHRARLRPHQREPAQPDRAAVHGPSLLRPRRHRPPLACRAGPDDPSLHPVAQPQRCNPHLRRVLERANVC